MNSEHSTFNIRHLTFHEHQQFMTIDIIMDKQHSLLFGFEEVLGREFTCVTKLRIPKKFRYMWGNTCNTRNTCTLYTCNCKTVKLQVVEQSTNLGANLQVREVKAVPKVVEQGDLTRQREEQH